jgi:hypothetical protein
MRDLAIILLLVVVAWLFWNGDLRLPSADIAINVRQEVGVDQPVRVEIREIPVLVTAVPLPTLLPTLPPPIVFEIERQPGQPVTGEVWEASHE